MFKASINWLHFGVLRLHVAEEMVAPRPDCAIPKMSSKVVRQHQNAGPEMRPFSVGHYAASDCHGYSAVPASLHIRQLILSREVRRDELRAFLLCFRMAVINMTY